MRSIIAEDSNFKQEQTKAAEADAASAASRGGYGGGLGHPPALPRRALSFAPDPVSFIILDFTLVLGVDHSALMVLEDTVKAAAAAEFEGGGSRGCRVIFSGCPAEVRRRIHRSSLPGLNGLIDKKSTTKSSLSTIVPVSSGRRSPPGDIIGASGDIQKPAKIERFVSDLDAALTYCEDELLMDVQDKQQQHSGATVINHEDLFQSTNGDSGVAEETVSNGKDSGALGNSFPTVTGDDTNFAEWLRVAGSRHHFDTAPLEDLGAFTTLEEWPAGSVILSEDHGTKIDLTDLTSGLRFLVRGTVAKKRDPAQSLTTKSKNRLLKLDRQSLHGNMREFRFSRFGAGWCIGLEDYFSGHRAVGVFEAEADCTLYFLPYPTLARLQRERPELVMHLLLLLGRLTAAQFSRTKERLSHVVDAMATTHSRKDAEALPSRRTMRLIQTLASRMR